ncbi:Molybdopterin-binding domain of aldehyde dehydrogenase [Aureimonas altamirensis DSM 21988]|uniref:Molybdopterin-binding domain of aldehyde dehydrogenase n=1 Tax=Aureimonas altamirensis DSM 21988 TaxID=1121026 RepID=A0ABY1IN64_9HYPH|nr:molybdopterin cofactor-binding domain-containing protein [Aureimonas altamirensis]SHJ54496.1 Molybdopterin-binding domain of aldehyde dehydrogenase [Aureimonas altamirensis DSM 21988]
MVSHPGFLVTGTTIGGAALVAGVGGIGRLATVGVDGLDGFVDGENARLNAFLTLHRDGRVVIQVPQAETGQGIHTGLAMLVAEELDIPFDDRISVVVPTRRHGAYVNWINVLQVRPAEAGGPAAWVERRALRLLGFLSTAASYSAMALWHPMRVAGASAREMLVAAAAKRLGLPASQLMTRNGFVHHEASGKRLSYGELAHEAAVLSPPREPALRAVADERTRSMLPA